MNHRAQLIELLKQHANPEATDWLGEVADAIIAAGWYRWDECANRDDLTTRIYGRLLNAGADADAHALASSISRELLSAGWRKVK